jgi:hypothetical protein
MNSHKKAQNAQKYLEEVQSSAFRLLFERQAKA